jgi:hypothetical protein
MLGRLADVKTSAVLLLLPPPLLPPLTLQMLLCWTLLPAAPAAPAASEHATAPDRSRAP